MTTQSRTREQSPRPGWPVPVALAALSAIPLISGALRLLQLAGGPEVIPAEERFAGFPLPVALHILGVSVIRSPCRAPPSTFCSAPSSSCRGSGATTGPGTAGPAGS